MTTSTSTTLHTHQSTTQHSCHTFRRHVLRDVLLRGIGFRFLVKVDVHALENIPAGGSTLLIMNHIAAIDPFVVVGAIRPRFVVPMSKVENYNHPIIGLMVRAWGAYPVRRGAVDRQALDNTVNLLNQNCPVLIAPEGTRHDVLQEPKDGMTYVALKAGAMVVPVGIEGTEQFPGSFKRLQRARVTLRIGRPFRFRSDGQARVPRPDMRQMTQEAMYQLAALLPPERRGAYQDLSQATTDFLDFGD